MAHKVHRPHNFRALSKPKQIRKSEYRHYWPYTPLLVLVIAAFFMSLVQPVHHRRVLAYATNVNLSGLLDATNNQRVQNGASSLKLNSTLSVAAQAKANDMVAQNYWSHTSPDGKQPWSFVASAGYKYEKAGENLAYGFLNSQDTITGWMNSSSHRSNMLDTAYSEVGFGFANSENFNGDGAQTVVVAMYGQPQVLAASNQTPAQPAAPAPAEKPAAEVTTSPAQTEVPAPVTSDSQVAEPATTAVTRVETLTKGNVPWALLAVGITSGLAIAALLIKHAAGVRHLIKDSERFVLHHPLLDFLLLSVVVAGSFLSQTTGFIR